MITGGSSGIGFAIAERFLREGASRVILVGRSFDRLAAAAARLEAPTLTAGEDSSTDDVATRAPEEDRQLRSRHTPTEQLSPGSLIESSERLHLLVGDVSDAGSWGRELEKAMQPVDILVNAAGISNSNILPRTEPSDISQVLRTNLEGALLTSRALVRASIRSRVKTRSASTPSADARPPSKCIINVSSLLALKGGTGAVPYAASKAGVLGLTRSLAVETAESLKGVFIRSNAIVPGYIETPMIADFTESQTSKLKESIPLRRFGRPDEVADAAVFLAHNEYANNCVLNLDGGLSAV
ncbi:NAD(P)-binding protein [Aspergillus campestris IBT 28561]|uniref:NAD(P)-binding protein n=1 Tax=Aspergillus campestris (strain IBT 28561) TaxID=1392248 RepID=A0A2I1D0H7_ASPC2|nr:NAD(P)-binding protein [Aspergillus campestris IBT 28561]PKY03374.1 NAD(P)-binding protein [Aspergillus campestris IBT 28561]